MAKQARQPMLPGMEEAEEPLGAEEQPSTGQSSGTSKRKSTRANKTSKQAAGEVESVPQPSPKAVPAAGPDPSTTPVPASSAEPAAAATEPASQPQRREEDLADAAELVAHAELDPDETLSELDLAGKVIYAVDSASLIFQVFHGLPEMSSPAGEPVNAVFGFARDLLSLLRDKQPDYLFAAWDTPEPTFRDELYTEYKANRSAMPESLAPQLPMIRELLEALGVPILERPGFEADDILATLARLADETGARLFVVSGDKDCRQLISEQVKIYNVRKQKVYDERALADDWGIRPDQVVDFQSLVGDTVDNVPGVPLIGPKIAQQLLEKYDTLENVLDHAHEVSGAKRKANLMAGREQAMLSRTLVRLDRNVEFHVDWANWRTGGHNPARLEELCGRFGFHRLADEIRDLSAEQEPVEWPHAYRAVTTAEEFQQFLTELKQQRWFSFDTETTSLAVRDAKLVGMSFAWEPGVAWYLPLRAPAGDPVLDEQATLEALRPILEDRSIGKLGQNLKFDMTVLRTAGVRLRGLRFDTMLASYLLNAGERNHNLDQLAKRHFNYQTTKLKELIGTGKSQRPVESVSLAEMAEYAGEDADVALRLTDVLKRQLADVHLDRLFETLELPLVEVLSELEYNGIRVDPTRLVELGEQFQQKMNALEAEIYALAGHEFNINSPKQLQQVLFDELKLPVVKRTQSGPSTDVDVLTELALEHALPAKVTEYRQYAKLKGTYVDALVQMIQSATGRVHASFNQVVAATGRLSSSDPNLQNIPIRSEEGREIRSAFLPQEGWQLLCADYSQIELRVLAHFTADETLCRGFEEDQDIHALVASQVHKVPLQEVTSAMRRQAKAVNFGIVYGQSPWGLARTLGIEKSEAALFIESYFEQYPGVEEFLAKTLAEARAKGYVTTILGRRRAIQGVRSVVNRQRNLPERTAINTVIQGSAADLIKQAMLSLHERIHAEKLATRMLLQIHDELVFEVPPEELHEVAGLVVRLMADVLPLAVPLKVDVAVGSNWFDVRPWPTDVPVT